MNKIFRSRSTSLLLLISSTLVVGCGSKPPPPVITQINPAAVCDPAPTRTFTIAGSGFLKNDLLPQVTFTKVDKYDGRGVLGVARAAHGTAIESAFVYQLAGLGAGGVVRGSLEQTIW